MEIKGNTICFKSDRVYYIKEESGLKPNTIRQLDAEEKIVFLNNLCRIKLIKIVCSENEQLHFIRELSDISFMGEWIIFSWKDAT